MSGVATNHAVIMAQLLCVCLCMLASIAQLHAQTCSELDDETLRRAHVEALKRALLFKMRLTEEPENPVGPIVVPRAVLDEYRAVSAAQELVDKQQTGCMQQTEAPSQYMVLQPYEVLRRSGYHGVFGDYPLSSSHTLRSSTHLLQFDLNLSSEDIILSVELRIWYRVLNRSSIRPLDKQRISIFHVIKQGDSNYFGEDPTHYCTREEVTLERDGYVSFNITAAFSQWLRSAEEGSGRFYLEVDVEDLQRVNDTGGLEFRLPAVSIAYTDVEGRYSKTTQLVMKALADLSSGSRTKRQVGETVDPSCTAAGTRNCCKRDLVLDIQRDLNWTWVLRPRKISAGFCSGYCSLNWPVATYHTLMNLIYTTTPGNPTGSPAPCCVPDKFNSLPFLIFNRTFIELVTIDDVSIQSCICR